MYGVALNMGYDTDLANRLREQLADEDGVTEKAMFGGPKTHADRVEH